MDLLPFETLFSIAGLLPHADLCQFRLVNRRCAAPAYPLISRHLFLLDTSWCTREFVAFVCEHDACLPFTRGLTIYYGDWPRCSRDDWETHPLLHHEVHPLHLMARRAGQPTELTHFIDHAYKRYTEFLAAEESRCPSGDKQALRFLLSCMPGIQTVTFRPYHTSLRRQSPGLPFASFANGIGIRPSFHSLSNGVVERCAELAPAFRTLTELCVEGRLDLERAALPEIKTVRSLKITSVRSIHGIRNFIAAFPCLIKFSFAPTTIVSLPLGQVALPELRFLFLSNVRVTEEALAHTITSTKSQGVAIECDGVTLANKTWEAFWAGMQQSGLRVTLTTGVNVDSFSVSISK
ncbi:hypothetical protein EDB80DRAFT_717287, partial [Ilyonectria destructans]